MLKSTKRRIDLTLLILFLIAFFFALSASRDLVVLGQTTHERRFTGRASSTVNDLAEPGQTYGLGTVVESHAEITIDTEGFARGTIRSVWDYQRSAMSCARRVTKIITLSGRLVPGTSAFNKAHIIGDPARSKREDKTTNLDAADKRQECREEFYPPNSEPTDWWGKFDNETTISIYLSRYSADQGFAGRVTGASEKKRQIETYKICEDGRTALRLPGVKVKFWNKGKGTQTFTTGADAKATGYFDDDVLHRVSAEDGDYRLGPTAGLQSLTFAYAEQGGDGGLSPGGYLNPIPAVRYDVKEDVGGFDWIALPGWQSASIIKIFMKDPSGFHDCAPKPQLPPPPIVLGDPKTTVKLINVKGSVHYFSDPPRSDWYPVTEGMQLPANTQIITGPGDSVTVSTQDGAKIDVKEMTTLGMRHLLDERGRAQYYFDVKRGELESQVPRQQIIRSDFSVQSITAAASVRGTIFTFRHDITTKTTTVIVKEGEVLVTPRKTSLNALTLNANQQVEISPTSVGVVRTIGTGGIDPAFRWVSTGTGDCGGYDIGQTVGSALPEATKCSAAAAGTIAVCWDGKQHSNGSGEWCTYKSKAASPCRGGRSPGFAYECRSAKSSFFIDDIVLPSGPSIRTQKSAYATNEQIVVEYSGLPGNAKDWISVVPAGSADDAYVGGQWTFTDGKRGGTFALGPLPAGRYEARVYFKWDGGGGYIVRSRHAFEVRTSIVP